MNFNFLDFLEIGCSIGTGKEYQKLTKEYNHDFIFMTSIGDRIPDGIYGISIDPVKNYLSFFDAPPTVNKLNCAVSSMNKISEVYYIDVEDAIKNNLYSWAIGCASLENPSEKLINHLEEKKCLGLLKKEKIKVIDIKNLIELYNILYIEYLKIDTEGQDYDILLSLFNSNRKISIDKIQFESKCRSEKLFNIKKYLKTANYIELYGGHDTFFINHQSITRLLTTPNILDKIFLEDIKYNIDIKEY